MLYYLLLFGCDLFYIPYSIVIPLIRPILVSCMIYFAVLLFDYFNYIIHEQLKRLFYIFLTRACEVVFDFYMSCK